MKFKIQQQKQSNNASFPFLSLKYEHCWRKVKKVEITTEESLHLKLFTHLCAFRVFFFTYASMARNVWLSSAGRKITLVFRFLLF